MTENAAQTVVSVFDVAPRRIGGVEMLAAELSRSLEAGGWRSVLVFPKQPSPLVEEFLKTCGGQILVNSQISNAGLAGARALYSIVQQTQAEHVHLNFTSFLSPMAWASRAAGAQAVYYTDQGSRAQNDMRRPYHKRLIGQFLTAAYRRVFCVSEYVRDQNVRCGYISPDRLTTLYNSIDFQRTGNNQSGQSFRKRFGIHPEMVLVSQVSWLRPEKGLEDLIQAAAIAIPKDPRLHFIIAGDGPYRNAYMQLCSQLGIGDHVTFTGLIDDPMGEGLYASSDIACQLSRWQEACAWVIPEAMAHGKPVIGTRVGGIPEVIEDGINGFIVPPCSPPDAAKRILELGQNEELRVAMGNAAHQKAKSLYDLHDNVGHLLSAYGMLSASRPSDQKAA